MKKLNFSLLVFVLICVLPAHSQSSSNSDDVQKTFTLQLYNQKNIPVYIDYHNTRHFFFIPLSSNSPWNKTNMTIDIDTITISIQDGYASIVNVYTKDPKWRQFTNFSAPITLNTDRLEKGDYLQSTVDRNYAILLKDFVLIRPEFPYLPDDTRIILSSDVTEAPLTRNVGVNNIFDARLYTDVLGLLNKETNPVVQTDIRFKHIVNRTNVPNTGFIMAQYLSLYASLSKFDSKDNFVDSSKFSRTSLIQKSIINIEGTINLFTSWLERKTLNSLFWDFGAGVHSTNLTSSTGTKSVLSNYLFTQVGLSLKPSENVGTNLCSRLMLQYSPETNFINNNQSNAMWYIKLGGEIFWNPVKDAASRLFFKANYLLPIQHDEKKNHFVQLQLGYSILVSKLLAGHTPGF